MALSVSPEIQARLLDLKDMDTEMIVARRNIRELSARVEALESDDAYQLLVREAENAADRVDDVTREKEHVEADIAVAHARIVRDREREASSSDTKELVALEAEISSLERRIAMLEEQQGEILERWAAVTAERDRLTTDRDSFHDQRSANQSQLRTEIAAHNTRIAAVENDRARLVAELPTDLVDLYERQRERYGVGASLLTRGISTASGVELTPYQLDVVKNADPFEVLMCPDSNAILIRTAESGL
jgi:predicted  nucleic acid-binding Zn-ribbon protein